MSVPQPAPKAAVGPSLRTALLWTLVTLAAGVGLQLAFYGHGGHHALSDLPGRFLAWRLGPNALPYIDRPVEYPVVIGYVALLMSVIGRTLVGFFVVNGVMNATLALLMTALLWHRGTPRIWRWVLGVPLALYAFQNWDLLAMVPAIVGLDAFRRGRDGASGVALAFGASVKVFPGLLIPPLVVVRWCSGDRRGALRLLGAAAITTVVLNLPVAASSWSGWTYPLTFQGRRTATWGSLWSWLVHVPGVHTLPIVDPPGSINLFAVIALVAAIATISYLAVRRQLDAFAIGAAVVGAFVLTNKIYSPTYDLWLLPFFVLLPISRKVWIGYWTSDLAIFVLVFGSFHGAWPHSVVPTILPALVAVRAVAIIAAIRTALRGPERTGDRDPDRDARPRTRPSRRFGSARREPVRVLADLGDSR